MGRDTICNFYDMNHANWAWDSATVVIKCHRVCNPPLANVPNPLNGEPVVAVVEAAPNFLTGNADAKGEAEERLGGAGGAGDAGDAEAPTSGIVHGSPRLKPSIRSLIPAESTVSA